MKKVVILWHNGGRLANQLWLFAGVYAYSLEKGYKLENHTFFEYADSFNIAPASFWTRLVFFRGYRWFKKLFPRSIKKNPHGNAFRRFYKLYVKTIEKFRSSLVLKIPSSEGAIVHYLPPTFPADLKVEDFDSSVRSVLYLDGWLFRNPKGLIKFRKEILDFFRPQAQILNRARQFVEPLNKKYQHIVGVHIRQGDYKFLWNGERYFSSYEVAGFLRQYLRYVNFNSDQTCFIICSDGPIEESYFGGLHITISHADEVTDLFILAQTGTIIGSDSTFGAFASYYGNIPFIVFQKKDMDWEYYKDRKCYFENKYSTLVHY